MAVRAIEKPGGRGAGPPTRILPIGSRWAVGLLFMVALLAFEIFNFDTTRYALTDFLGDAAFVVDPLGAAVRWATVLAIAFCAIDFAGLLRFFLPETDGEISPEIWYLMGAWLLGATMNAIMTWWAVNLALLDQSFGNEVLSRGLLLEVVPIFVAVLVWITRILFIGAFTVAGGHLFELGHPRPARRQRAVEGVKPVYLRPTGQGRREHEWAVPGEMEPLTDEVPAFLRRRETPEREEHGQRPSRPQRAGQGNSREHDREETPVGAAMSHEA